jgi:hypothetical protein
LTLHNTIEIDLWWGEIVEELENAFYLAHGRHGRRVGVREEGEEPLPSLDMGVVHPVPNMKKTSPSFR